VSERMSEDAKMVQIALAVGFLELVLYEEKQISPKGGMKIDALEKLMACTWEVCDFYKVNAVSPIKLSAASNFLDEVELLVKQRFGPKKRVIRGKDGKFKSEVV